jgi:hypothetical protein
MIRFLIGNIIMVLILIGDDIYRRADTPHTCPERQSKGPTPQTGGFRCPQFGVRDYHQICTEKLENLLPRYVFFS